MLLSKRASRASGTPGGFCHVMMEWKVQTKHCYVLRKWQTQHDVKHRIKGILLLVGSLATSPGIRVLHKKEHPQRYLVTIHSPPHPPPLALTALLPAQQTSIFSPLYLSTFFHPDDPPKWSLMTPTYSRPTWATLCMVPFMR